MTNVKTRSIRKNRLPAIHHIHPVLALQLFSGKTLTLQQNQSHQIDEGAHGEHFQPKISHKKLRTYPLNPKISGGELDTFPLFVPVKERPLALTLRMSPCTYVIHWGCTSTASLSLTAIRYNNTTTTTAVLSSVAHTFSHYSTISDLELSLESDHMVKINKSQIF